MSDDDWLGEEFKRSGEVLRNMPNWVLPVVTLTGDSVSDPFRGERLEDMVEYVNVDGSKVMMHPCRLDNRHSEHPGWPCDRSKAGLRTAYAELRTKFIALAGWYYVANPTCYTCKETADNRSEVSVCSNSWYVMDNPDVTVYWPASREVVGDV